MQTNLIRKWNKAAAILNRSNVSWPKLNEAGVCGGLACGFIYYLLNNLKYEYFECINLISDHEPAVLAKLIQTNSSVRRKLSHFIATVQQLQTMQHTSSATANGIYGNAARMGMNATSITCKISNIESINELFSVLEKNPQKTCGIYIAIELHAYSVTRTIDKNNQTSWHVIDANAEKETFSHTFSSKETAAAYMFERIKSNAGMQSAIVLRDRVPFKNTIHKILHFMQTLVQGLASLMLPDFITKIIPFEPVIARGILMTSIPKKQNALQTIEPAVQDFPLKANPRSGIAYAILTHNIIWLREILKNNPDLDLNQPCPLYNRPEHFARGHARPITMAVWSNHIATVDELLERKVKVSLQDVAGAIEFCNEEVTLKLIDHMVDHSQLLELLPFSAFKGAATVCRKIMEILNVNEIGNELDKLIVGAYPKKTDQEFIRNFICGLQKNENVVLHRP